MKDSSDNACDRAMERPNVMIVDEVSVAIVVKFIFYNHMEHLPHSGV